MAKRKIAFIITQLQLGGAQKSVLYSVNNMPKDKFETYLLGDLFKTPYVKARIVDKTIPDKLFFI